MTIRLPAPDPRANPASMVIHGNARFTVLTSRMFRIEYAADGCFEDRATLAVVNRRLPTPRFTTTTTRGRLVIRTEHAVLTYRPSPRGFASATLSIAFRHGRRRATWRFGQRDPHNLGGTVRTLDGAEGDQYNVWKQNEQGRWEHFGKAPIDLGHGFLSRRGWAVFDDSRHVVLEPRPDAFTPWAAPRADGPRHDQYVLCHGLDYKSALADAARVFGRQPLPPRYALGYWYSRYWAYTDREIERIVAQFDEMNVPLDVMVIDMDWHLQGWTGYTWDRDYFPDPDAHLRTLRARGIKITLNLHPADGVGRHEAAFPFMCRDLGLDPDKTDRIPFDCTDPAFMHAYFKRLHHPEEERGVDFWWMDWQQGEQTKLANLDPLPWLNHLHWHDQLRHRPRRRALNFSRYGGPGSGRYPVGFSGDTHSTWESLAYQPHFTATAANVLYGAWSHDIGGHQPGPIGGELFARWIQFGAYSPVLRTHTSKNREAERRVWLYPEPYRDVMMETLRQRYRMIPYIYTEMRRAVDHAVSLVRPMYIEHPGHEQAYRARGQYYFGAAMLVAPVCAPVDAKTEMAPVDVWLPPGRWFDVARGCIEAGNRRITRSYLLEEVPVFVRAGAILPEQAATTRTRPGSYPALVLQAYPGGDGEYALYEDDGETTDYLDGHSVEIPLAHGGTPTGGRRVEIGPARGAFDGFLARRPVTVHVHGSAPPRGARVNGKPVPWKFDGDRGVVIVDAGALNLKRRNRIEVLADPQAPALFHQGWSGLMRRLGKVGAYANLVSPPHPVHPEERLAIRLAQTGNRLSRRPDSAVVEIARFRKTLRRLPKALEEFQNEYRLRNDTGAAEILQKARDILNAIE